MAQRDTLVTVKGVVKQEPRYKCEMHGDDGPFVTDDFHKYWLHMKECHNTDVTSSGR